MHTTITNFFKTVIVVLSSSDKLTINHFKLIIKLSPRLI